MSPACVLVAHRLWLFRRRSAQCPTKQPCQLVALDGRNVLTCILCLDIVLCGVRKPAGVGDFLVFSSIQGSYLHEPADAVFIWLYRIRSHLTALAFIGPGALSQMAEGIADTRGDGWVPSSF